MNRGSTAGKPILKKIDELRENELKVYVWDEDKKTWVKYTPTETTEMPDTVYMTAVIIDGGSNVKVADCVPLKTGRIHSVTVKASYYNVSELYVSNLSPSEIEMQGVFPMDVSYELMPGEQVSLRVNSLDIWVYNADFDNPAKVMIIVTGYGLALGTLPASPNIVL